MREEKVGGGRGEFTYIEGELAVSIIRNYEWIAGHSMEALRKDRL